MELDFIDVSRDDGRRRSLAGNTRNRSELNARYAPGDREGASNIRKRQNRAERTPDRRRMAPEEGSGLDTRLAPNGRNRSNARSAVSAGNASAPRRRQGAGNAANIERRQRPGNAQARDGRRAPGTAQQAVKNTRRRARPVDPEVQQEQIRRRNARRRKRIMARFTVLLCMTLMTVFFVGGMVFMAVKLFARTEEKQEVKPVMNVPSKEEVKEPEGSRLKPVISEDFLTVNEYSRPGEELTEVKNIFVHYTANKGTSAAQNRSYFQNLGTTGETSASAHFIIGYDGEIVQCIPLSEIAYAVQGRNYDSVSIECCYKYDDGRFTDETYQSLIRLCAWLLDEYHLGPEDMRRHYDEGGKKCPLYFVEHPDSWEQFKRDLGDYIAAVENKDKSSEGFL